MANNSKYLNVTKAIKEVHELTLNFIPYIPYYSFIRQTKARYCQQNTLLMVSTFHGYIEPVQSKDAIF